MAKYRYAISANCDYRYTGFALIFAHGVIVIACLPCCGIQGGVSVSGKERMTDDRVSPRSEHI